MRRREFMGRGMAALVVGVASPRLYSGEGPASRTPSRFDALLAEETRLYANENPYGPPPEARAAIDDVLGCANRYGSYGTNGRLMEPSELEARIAARESVAADQVLVTHGATEALQLCASAFGGSGIATQVPTYPTILGYARAMDRPIHVAPLRDDYHYDFRRLREAVAAGAGCVYLCQPNNPTGLIEPQGEIEALCRELTEDAVVVVDEAYHEFVQAPGYGSLVGLIREGVDLVVLRTFSKAYGMAGMRVGYVLGRPERLRPLRGLQVGPINVVSLIGVRAALESESFLPETRAKLTATRTRVTDVLAELGLSWLPSETNFLLIDVGRPERSVIAGLNARDVRVGSAMQRDSTRIRLTIGTDAEIDRFLAALRAVLA